MNITKKAEPFDHLADALERELLDMSDEDILEGRNGDAAKANGLRLLKAAKAAAGKQRLAAAKGAVALARSGGLSAQPEVKLDDIKAYIRKASNDGRYTLAARGLDEMTESDLRRIYAQLKRLEASLDSSEDDGQ
ncbi:TPA: hypothetical protein QDC55_005989 [Burkholderia cenocepacia]|uniref:hypothetical protein n=1 Tax=Burkholderia cepacia complex TaxID=87882 RepID=UPI000F603FE4|nr:MULTISPECIES: hypothetical protein [Burkholderia cepacia complex]MEB2610634.1 hypothetical protein [Burkholderia cenocepacia]RQY30725.1 hypothetical protein DF113_33465 [Burkholderia stagnalis]HDR9808156.1 hypothetical protein [Burkholderia cenocepacia]HDR9814992.1 hypothetical protein [Burkholderia cenocepacia]HDR9821446.1 hypothetical protein [Burkholderia cenocepacia]